MPELPLLPAELPWLMPDRIRDRIDETNITMGDLRDKHKELEKLAARRQVDQSQAVRKTLRKVAREYAHYCELMKLRTIADARI